MSKIVQKYNNPVAKNNEFYYSPLSIVVNLLNVIIPKYGIVSRKNVMRANIKAITKLSWMMLMSFLKNFFLKDFEWSTNNSVVQRVTSDLLLSRTTYLSRIGHNTYTILYIQLYKTCDVERPPIHDHVHERCLVVKTGLLNQKSVLILWKISKLPKVWKHNSLMTNISMRWYISLKFWSRTR